MALEIDVTGTPIETIDGDTVENLWVLLEPSICEKPAPHVNVRLRLYRSEAAHDAGRAVVIPRPESIPHYLKFIEKSLTNTQYGSVPNTTIHNVIAAILEEGDSHSLWDALYPGQVWAGLGADTVTVVMPS